MTTHPDGTPSIEKHAFNCPHCGAFSQHAWYEPLVAPYNGGLPHDQRKMAPSVSAGRPESLEVVTAKMKEARVAFLDQKAYTLAVTPVANCTVSICAACRRLSYWEAGNLIFPQSRPIITPNADLPDDIRADFIEALEIVQSSPRGAAALLRLCVQKLCKELGETGEDINKDIGALVKKGLNPVLQQALDTVRVIGNESVHPGTIDMRDDGDTALALFRLVNLIAEQLISTPKHVASLYATLPQKKLDGITQRDAPKA